MIWIFSAFVVVAGIVWLVNVDRKGADLVSYAIARGSYGLLPQIFPKHDAADLQLWRTRFSQVSSLSESSFKASVLDVFINLTGNSLTQKLRVYNGQSDEILRPVLIFYFGGGFVVGSVESNDNMCKQFAQFTNFVVVSIQYRLAPEHPFPAGFNDAHNGYLWVVHHIAHYGGDPAKIFMSGESAGGNLATGVIATVLQDESYVDNIKGFLSIYPGLSKDVTRESYKLYGQFNGILTTELRQNNWKHYAGNSTVDEFDFRFQPIHTPDYVLRRFPPTILVIAELDVLRDDGLLFAKRLRDNDAKVEVMHYPTTIHGFFGRSIFPHGIPAQKAACKKLLQLALFA